MRLTPVTAMFGLTHQPADARVGCFQALLDGLLYIFMSHRDLKVGPFFPGPAHKPRDSRSLSSLREIAMAQLLFRRRILALITELERVRLFVSLFAGADYGGTCAAAVFLL